MGQHELVVLLHRRVNASPTEGVIVELDRLDAGGMAHLAAAYADMGLGAGVSAHHTEGV